MTLFQPFIYLGIVPDECHTMTWVHWTRTEVTFEDTHDLPCKSKQRVGAPAVLLLWWLMINNK